MLCSIVTELWGPLPIPAVRELLCSLLHGHSHNCN